MLVNKFQKTTRDIIRSFRYPPIASFADQFLFGHREILLRTLNLEEHLIFRCELQHGWQFVPDDLAKRDYYFRFTKIPKWLWNPRLKEQLPDRKSSLVVGSPWAHFQTSQPSEELTTARSGVLYFPNHSYQHFKVPNNIFHDLKTIRRNFPNEEVIVSLYWLDFLDPKIYELCNREADRVVCSGFRGSLWNQGVSDTQGGRVNFLINLDKTIRQARLVVCNNFGTAFWYSLSLGMETKLLGELSHLDLEIYNLELNTLKNFKEFVRDNYNGATERKSNLPTQTSREIIARLELGYDYAMNEEVKAKMRSSAFYPSFHLY